MAFKPGRKIPGVPDLTDLRGILNQTNTSLKNNPLYQFCNSLLLSLEQLQAYFQKLIDGIDVSSSSSSSTTSGLDYVVLSDGALPTPNPVNDGFGNFIYIPYEP
jgi:hypothetical protein